jgi:hypothetical protein
VLEPASLPTVPAEPGKGVRKGAARSPAAKAPAKPPADRSLLDAAEARLRDLDERNARQEADLRRRQEALDAERAAAHVAYVDGRKAAAAEVVAARQQYRKAGGKD